MTVLAGSRVVTPMGVLSPGLVEMDGGRVTSVVPTTGLVPDRILAPGLIDLQVNGIDDVDVATADAAGWERLDHLLAAQGTTTWLPTLVTAPLGAYPDRIEAIATAAGRPGARPHIAGVHLEGPFLGSRPGAHPPQLVRPPDAEWIAGLPAIVKLVTLGAEGPGALDGIRAVVARRGLAAVGHSDATLVQATAAIDAGARLATHGFNAMSGLHHREPGLVGAFLTDDRVAVSLVADGIHVHPAALDVAFRCKPDGRIALVTDAVAWRTGRADEIGLVHDGSAPRLADGTIAGSSLTMDAAVAFVVGRVGVSLERAVRAASATPAALLGLHDRGALASGRRADVVALDPHTLRCTETWIGGTQVQG
ncbi:N-acetylglucosamine-6-phosphate deacetylase [Iamia sp.]|uniref:N-acetylglucosamine-6-phosphate deacetylase n=1 Tax=Iamia sp. TaxID=2722710 RepID=UPI002B65D91C|nr:amidohydrolase family protein [Iamia sp.]HXH59255.1 amidohydrolase family protein [Iamia sp.]